jgi:hypothetical protein
MLIATATTLAKPGWSRRQPTDEQNEPEHDEQRRDRVTP